MIVRRMGSKAAATAADTGSASRLRGSGDRSAGAQPNPVGADAPRTDGTPPAGTPTASLTALMCRQLATPVSAPFCSLVRPCTVIIWGRYLYDVRKFFGFFDPPPPRVAYRIQATSFLLSAFWGAPPPTHCGRHISMPPCAPAASIILA